MQDKKGGDDWTSPSFSQVKLIALFHVVLPGKPLGASSQRHTKGGDFVCLVSSLWWLYGGQDLRAHSVCSLEGRPDKDIAAEAWMLCSATHEAAGLLLCPPARGPRRLT